MPTIKHILFPCDFSEQGSLTVPFVRAIASRFDARITLLNISPDGVEPPAALPTAQQAGLDVFAREFAGLRVESVTDSGDPGLCITEFAQDNAVDLIMMPTYGYDLVQRLVIGSVTAKVLHDSHCPVWTATYAEEQQSASTPRTVLCALDGTPKSLGLLQWAAAFSHQMGAELKLIHVSMRISDALALASEKELQDEVNEQARAAIESLQKSAGIEAPLRVSAGPIADVVTDVADEEGADLILIGRGALQGTLGRLRTHIHSIIQKAPCPVLSI